MNRRYGKKMVCLLLSLCLFAGMVPWALYAYAQSDEDTFFQTLNTNTEGLEELLSEENRANRYAGAKAQLLNYYRNKLAGMEYITFNTQSTSARNTLKNQILLYNETFLQSKSIRGTEDFASYTYDLSSSQVRSSYMLVTYQNSTNVVQMQADPVLTVQYTNGTTKQYPAGQHTYIRFGDGVTHGQDAVLYAGHKADGQMPFSEQDARIYVDFGDVNTANVQNATLTLSARVTQGDGEVADEGQALQLLLVSHCLGKWDASRLTWQEVKKNHQFGFYSWDGVEGGIVWNEGLYGEKYQEALGVSDEFLNYNARLIQVSSLCQTGNYTDAKKALLRFVMQTYSAIESGQGFPKNRPLEPANRALEFPYIYKSLLLHDALTPEENYTILRWLFADMQFIVSEKTGVIYRTGTKDTIGSNSTAFYTNWGIWHINGLYNCIQYFGEFREVDSWKQIFNARLNKVFGAEDECIVFRDGSYREVTFGYAINVLEWLSGTLHILGEEGSFQPESATMANVKGALISMVHYMLTCTYPNGILPDYGDQSGNKRLQYALELLLDLPDIGDNLSGENARKLDEIRWVFSMGECGQQPPTFALYPDSALATDRTDWNEDSTMLFFNAKSGGGHAHRDALSLLFYAKGRELLVDRGTKSYEEKDPSNVLRTKTWVANTVSIENSFGKISQQTLGKQTTGQNDMAGVSNRLSGTYCAVTDTYRNIESRADVLHKRNVTFVKNLDLLLVNDSLEPQEKNTTLNTYVQNWQVGNKANAESHTAQGEDNVRANTNFATGANLFIAQGASDDGSIPKHNVKDFEGEVYSVSTGERNHIMFSRSGSGNVSFNTALLAYGENSPYNRVQITPIQRKGVSDAQSSVQIIRLLNRGQTTCGKEIVYYNAFVPSVGGKKIPVEKDGTAMTVQGQNAYFIRNDKGQIEQLYLANGQVMSVYKGRNRTEAYVKADHPVSDVTIFYNEETHTIEIETSDEGLLQGTTRLSFYIDGETPVLRLNGAATHKTVQYKPTLRIVLYRLWRRVKNALFGWWIAATKDNIKQKSLLSVVG